MQIPPVRSPRREEDSAIPTAHAGENDVHDLLERDRRMIREQ